ncbi:YraN family protein, partial [Planctomycetota bacterium]
WQRGEIDIIAEVPDDGQASGIPGELVFCEVKSRSYRLSEEPMLEAIPRAKRRKLALTAVRYCQEHRLTRHMRFDVIAVGRDRGGAIRLLSHLPNAFACDDLRLDF